MATFLKRIFESRLLFVITLLVIIYGLFFVPNSDVKIRLWTEIWNLGHIGAFLCIWLFMFNIFPKLQRLSTIKLILLVCISTLLLGELIEILQGLVGRDDELQDVWDSGVGALLAVGFFSSQICKFTRWQRYAWRLLALVVFVAVPWSIWSALADEYFIRREFPVLCDFSTPFELSRWQKNTATIHLQKAGEPEVPSLVVDFLPAMYSTVTLKYFYPDWHGYKHIVLDVTNPESAGFRVIVRIHDRWHKRHQYALNDRFNRALLIHPGRQRVAIDMDDVQNAPVSRKMDMRLIEELSLFTMQSKSQHHLWINEIYLE